MSGADDLQQLPMEAYSNMRFQFSLRTFFIVVFVIAVIMLLCSLPIWHQHESWGGVHGHPIWDWGHVH